MFCPQCGQQQLSGEVRFCSACGLPLNVVADVLAGGGQLRWRPPEPGGRKKLSPRQKGIRQGAMLMLSVTVVMPVLIFLGVSMLNLPGELIPLVGALCVMGGLLRMLYAVLFEEGDQPVYAPNVMQHYVPPAAPNYFAAPPREAALPAAQNRPVAAQPPRRYRTGELVERPPSVTENTTRLLHDRPDEPPAP
jgi:hypothetical protein